jgi:WD40 repeat protein
VLNDGQQSSVDRMAFSSDGWMLAAEDWNGRAYLWRVPAGKLAATPKDPKGPVTSLLTGESRTAVFSVAFSPDGRTLATSDTNGSADLWRVR